MALFFHPFFSLHMLVEERSADTEPRLEFKYKIQSGPSTVQSYGLALARCLRFPSTLLDRAEEISHQINDESLIDITRTTHKTRADQTCQKTVIDSEAMEVDEADETSNASQQMAALDRDVIDLYSHILLMMTESEHTPTIDEVNQKLEYLIEKMSPEFKDLVRKFRHH